MMRYAKFAVAVLLLALVVGGLTGCRSSDSGSSGRAMPRLMEGSGGR